MHLKLGYCHNFLYLLDWIHFHSRSSFPLLAHLFVQFLIFYKVCCSLTRLEPSCRVFFIESVGAIQLKLAIFPVILRRVDFVVSSSCSDIPLHDDFCSSTAQSIIESHFTSDLLVKNIK